MSFQANIGTLLLLFYGCLAAFEGNPFLQNRKVTKDVNQFNVAVIVPSGKEPFLTKPGEKPPDLHVPGYVWVQIPISTNVNKPPTDQSTKVPTTSLPQEPTKEPIFTIEPPEILYGNDLTRFCLKPTGQFPGRACNRYVNCWAGNAVEQECSGNLLFNPEKLYCDFPVNVNCRRKPDVHITPTPITSTTTIQKSPFPESILDLRATKFCQKSSGVFPGSSCSKFVNCWNGTAVEQECPDGLFFSTEGYCDYPERVSCGRIEKEVAKECPLEFGTFRNRSDCSRYYICAYNKIAATYKCPDGFSFSDLLGICDYSFRVDCSKEPQIYQRKFVDGNNLLDNAFAHPDLSKPSATGDPRCTVSFGTTRDEKNCSLYYVCEFGNVVATHVCPPGYLYSNIFNACDRAEKVNCQHGPSPTILAFPNLSKDLISKVKKCIPGTTFPLNSDCTIACRCRNGLAEVIQCAAGLAYDSKMDKCLVAYKAQC